MIDLSLVEASLALSKAFFTSPRLAAKHDSSINSVTYVNSKEVSPSSLMESLCHSWHLSLQFLDLLLWGLLPMGLQGGRRDSVSRLRLGHVHWVESLTRGCARITCSANPGHWPTHSVRHT